jgi:hypothetical protein
MGADKLEPTHVSHSFATPPKGLQQPLFASGISFAGAEYIALAADIVGLPSIPES